MRDEWLSGAPTTPTNTRFVSAILAFVLGPSITVRVCGLYTRIKLVDINMGNWTSGTRENRRICWAKGRLGVCPVANIEGGWLMAGLYVPRNLLTALSWADKGWASTHPHEKGWLGCGSSWHDEVESSVWFECETQWKCNSILREDDFGPGPYWILLSLWNAGYAVVNVNRIRVNKDFLHYRNFAFMSPFFPVLGGFISKLLEFRFSFRMLIKRQSFVISRLYWWISDTHSSINK